MMKTVFLRVIEADVDEKAVALRAGSRPQSRNSGGTRFEIDPMSLMISDGYVPIGK